MIRLENGIEAHIEGEGNERDHSSAGAIHAFKRGKHLYAVAAAIAGHHAGLADQADLRQRLILKQHLYEAVVDRLPPAPILSAAVPDVPEWIADAKPGDEAVLLRLEMHTRMLFSALCDADFLDTELFFSVERAEMRSGRPSVSFLAERLDLYLQQKEAVAPPTTVNVVRGEVRRACAATAVDEPGIFSLTVPTGGGKTLASMSFALEHARLHRLHRVVVAIPFTSIIEQTASVFRDVFGDDAIVEHHSALDPIHEKARNRIASENWDAPLIVTTNVQLFESLLSNRPSACRKLHRLARSVIILDEAQALPGHLLPAILDVLARLVQHYGATVVICTATQPAWFRSERLPMGFADVREICPSDMDLFARLRRVEATVENADKATPYDEVASWIAAEPNCLAIVHRRDDAQSLCRTVDARLAAPSTIHLSALMTPAHRSEVLAQVRQLQLAGRPVRLVATQLVEAGVDLDFPVVFRALAGLDALAQAAGRCNREGRLARGSLRIFIAETEPPLGVPRTGRDIARVMMARRQLGDLFSPAVQLQYFRELYDRTDLRRGLELQKQRASLNFATVSKSFQLIQDGWSAPLVIAHGDGKYRLDDLKVAGPSRSRLRALQRFTINVPRRFLLNWVNAGVVSVVADSVHALEGPALASYDPRFGLIPERMGYIDPTQLIVG
jgi:CRISPR-associated endonuclease/helicase Cas3